MNDKNRLQFDIKINPLDSLIEKYVIGKLNKNPPESYDKIKQKELEQIYNGVIDNFTKEQTNNFYVRIILSIRANLMREHMMITHKKIMFREKKIISDYNSGLNLVGLVSKYDYSPLNLLRLIFQSKYHKKLTKIMTNLDLLDLRDKSQLDWAINHDAYALINQDEILTKSNEFENKIKFILDKLSIRYKTQLELSDEQIKLEGIASNTPDFLIMDELFINGIKINWIDAKNFYGSNTKFMIKKTKSQTKKYINKWGSGSIIFNLGFNSDLSIDNILMIDYKSFSKI